MTPPRDWDEGAGWADGPEGLAQLGMKSLCLSCIHREPHAWTCAAFPDGIPNEIIGGRVPHTSPYPGDHGIRYEPLSE